ncbi:MAG: response regulator [Polyangiales bacterium]
MGPDGSRATDAPPTLVVADDDAITLAHVTRILSAAGYQVLGCSRGSEVLEKVRAGGVSLVLVDCAMPGMGGLEVCRILKATAEDVFVPVILMAARADASSRVEGLRNGADDFVQKPFDDDELVARVQNMLRIKQMHDAVRLAKTRLESLAGKDERSALYTESYVRSRLHQEFRRSERYQEPLAFLLLQAHAPVDATLDLGAASGQSAFATLAERVVQTVRETDVAAKFARSGIAVVLPATHFQGSLVVAERLWRAVTARPVAVDGTELAFSATLDPLFPSRPVARAEDMVASAMIALENVARRRAEPICVAQHDAYFFAPQRAEA